MKSILFAACLCLAITRNMTAAENAVSTASASASVSVEVDAVAMRYRVHLVLPPDVGYDSSALTPAADGLAPRGVRVLIEDDSGRPISAGGSERCFSSSDLSSGSRFDGPGCILVPASSRVQTEWFSIADLVRGFEQCSGMPPETWARIQIVVSVRTCATQEGRAEGQSEWLVITPAMRQAMKTDL